jgi:hypothetical protein
MSNPRGLTDEERMKLILKGVIKLPPPTESWQDGAKTGRLLSLKYARATKLLAARDGYDPGDPYKEAR